jgi:hypothetical protein
MASQVPIDRPGWAIEQARAGLSTKMTPEEWKQQSPADLRNFIE